MADIFEKVILNESPDFRVLWAKSRPRHPLWKHLLDSAAVSGSVHRAFHFKSVYCSEKVPDLHPSGRCVLE